MIYVLIGLAALGVLLTAVIIRTRSLNDDPRQLMLANCMLTAVKEVRDGRPLLWAWHEDVVPYFVGLYGDLRPGPKRTRAAHALSMIRPMLTQDEYDILRNGYCRTLANYDDDALEAEQRSKSLPPA